METKFKVGDRVMCTDDGNRGVVKGIEDNGYVVLFDDGVETWLEWYLLQPYDATKQGRKNEFLQKLSDLLKEFDARIYDGEMYAIHIEIGCHSTNSEQADFLFYKSEENEINADNIMNFKEY